MTDTSTVNVSQWDINVIVGLKMPNFCGCNRERESQEVNETCGGVLTVVFALVGVYATYCGDEIMLHAHITLPSPTRFSFLTLRTRRILKRPPGFT